MDDIHIAFVGQRKRVEFVPSPSKFHSHPRNWLQRAFWKLLVRLGAVSRVMEPNIKYTQLTLRGDDVLKEIAVQRRFVFDETGDKPLRILMGRDKFTQLTGAPYDEQMNYAVVLMKEPRKVMDMEITTVPWMTGMVVLP
jgi:hypothetical protein